MYFLEELFWLITAAVFPVLLIINYFALKRFREKHIIEKIVCFIFNGIVLFVNYCYTYQYGEVRESVYEMYRGDFIDDINDITFFMDSLNTLYFIMLLFLTVLLLISVINKTKYNNNLFFGMAGTFAAFFLFIFISGTQNHLFRLDEANNVVGAYSIMMVMLLICAGYLFCDVKSNRRFFIVYNVITYLILAASLILCFASSRYLIYWVLDTIYLLPAAILPIFKIREYKRYKRAQFDTAA